MIKLVRIQQNQECFYTFSFSKGKYELVAFAYQQIQLIIVREGKKKDEIQVSGVSKLNNKNGKFLVSWWRDHP